MVTIKVQSVGLCVACQYVLLLLCVDWLQIIQLFTHVLIGNYDGSVFRYFLLLCDFIDLVDWRQVDDFRNFAAVVYPHLNVKSQLRIIYSTSN